MDDMESIARADLLGGDVDLTAHEELVANSIAIQVMGEVMEYLKHTDTIPKVIRETETRAVKALEEIRDVLNDDSYSDRECFYQIDAIVSILAGLGIYTHRHDW